MWGDSPCIACVDMNAFFAAVEQYDDKSLRQRPVAVINGQRGSCIITASYEARAYGIHTGMRLYEALQKCPHLLVRPSRAQRYAQVSQQIMNILYELTPDIEVFSVDEAFLDFTAMYRRPSAYNIAQSIQQKITECVGLPASVGIATNKTVAKYAAKYRKPQGITVISPERTQAVIAPLALSEICGIGPGIQRFLARYGATRCADVARLPVNILSKRFGAQGRQIWLMCQGKDPQKITKFVRRAQTIGHSKILPPGSRHPEVIRQYVYELAFKLSERMQKNRTWCRYVYLSIRYRSKIKKKIRIDFQQSTNTHSIFMQYIDKVLVTLPIQTVAQIGMCCSLEYTQQKNLLLPENTVDEAGGLQEVVRHINACCGPHSIQFAKQLSQRVGDTLAPSWRPNGIRNYLNTECV